MDLHNDSSHLKNDKNKKDRKTSCAFAGDTGILTRRLGRALERNKDMLDSSGSPQLWKY